MKTIEEVISTEESASGGYPIDRICENPEKLLFVDIETTGLSARFADIYLIGCAYFRDGSWRLIQWFAENRDDEAHVLRSFIDFASGFSTILTFNGDRFDLPFIQARCDKHEINYTLEEYESVDLYRKVSPYKTILGLSDCKQKTVEQFLGINREDIYNGGQLIELYEKYTDIPNDELFGILVLHNADDVRGMFKLLPILYFCDFFDCIKSIPAVHMSTEGETRENDELLDGLPVRAVKVQANYYKDINGMERQEILMKLAFKDSIPCGFKCSKDDIFVLTDEDSARLRVPLLEDELKYFYSNYKDYYYLPDEDQALHKSVAQFVDRSHREQAKAENCYTRKPGQFLREWDLVFTPFFKKEYRSHEMYFELTDDIKTSRTAMSLYACHVLQFLFDLF